MRSLVVPCGLGRAARRASLPLIANTLRNSPCADGMPSRQVTLLPPPDSPKIVTLAGSPPNSRDVVAHPLERGDDVEHADVARVGELVAEV